jgi:anti-sigma B factor antagonist
LTWRLIPPCGAKHFVSAVYRFGPFRAFEGSKELDMALSITRGEQDGVSILQLTGRLTFGSEEAMLNDEIRRALASRRTRLVIDMAGVDRIDSAGLGTLLYARAELRRAGGGLALAHVHPMQRKAIRIAGLESAFEISNTQQGAIDSLLPDPAIAV